MSVIIQMWRRLAPSRTKKLSTSWVMILRLTGRGKVAHCGLVNSTYYSYLILNLIHIFLFLDFYGFRSRFIFLVDKVDNFLVICVGIFFAFCNL